MPKKIHIEIVSRDAAKHIARIMGPSSAAASALRTLEEMGADADQFEICRDIGARMLVLIEKANLSDPRLTVTNGNHQ